MNLRTLLSEPSTWRGIVWLLTAAGITLNPEQQSALIALGMAIAGVIGVIFIDPPKDITGNHKTTSLNRPSPFSLSEADTRPNDHFNDR